MRSTMRSDHRFLKRAIELARISSSRGESPFGALIAKGSEVLGEGSNETRLSGLPTRHAEMVAIDRAVASAGTRAVNGATLYASCAPCIMCLGAIYYAGITRVVYALSIKDALDCGSGDLPLEPDDFMRLVRLPIQVSAGQLRDAALKVIREAYKRDGSI